MQQICRSISQLGEKYFASRLSASGKLNEMKPVFTKTQAETKIVPIEIRMKTVT